jgi:hypothetical protein
MKSFELDFESRQQDIRRPVTVDNSGSEPYAWFSWRAIIHALHQGHRAVNGQPAPGSGGYATTIQQVCNESGDGMDHHEHHRQEREHKKEERKEHEHEQEKQVRTIHPTWFVVIGIILIAGVVLVWTVW